MRSRQLDSGMLLLRPPNELDSRSNAARWHARMLSPDDEGRVTVQTFLGLKCASPPRDRRNTPSASAANKGTNDLLPH